MSRTIQGARHLALFGLLLLAGLAAMEWNNARPETITSYVSFAEVVFGAISVIVTSYSARNWPTANRAPTSAELAAGVTPPSTEP